MTTSSLPRTAPVLAAEPGVRFALAHVGLVTAALAVGLLHPGADAGLTVLVLAAVAGGAGLAPAWAGGLGVSAWALWTGFLENAAGRLTLTGPDLLRLGLAVAASTLLASYVVPLLGRATGRHDRG